MISSQERREIFARYYAIGRLLEHLDKAVNDHRPRERARADIAKTKVNEWLKEGRDVYDIS